MTAKRIFQIITKAAFWVVITLFSFILMTLNSSADPDLWHRMAVGRIFSQTGSIIYNDIFSYLPKREMWVDHEWLSGVLFNFLGSTFGDYGIMALQVLATVLVILLIYKTNKLICNDNKDRISFYLTIVIGMFIAFSSPVRCHVFTYMFFTLWIYLLEKIRRGESRFLWIFPITMLLWTNFHGGFLSGFGLIVFYIIGDFLNKKDISKYLLIIALCLPVTLINPYGIKYWQYIFDAATMSRSYIAEWGMLNPFRSFYTAPGLKILFLFLVLGYGYSFLSKKLNFKNVDKVELVALLITLYMSIKHERHSVFFVIVAGIYGYQHFVAFLDATIGNFEKTLSKKINKKMLTRISFLKACFIYVPLLSVCIFMFVSMPKEIKLDRYPVRAIEFISQNNLSGNLFVPFNWGSYALWKLYPQNLVSIDGRFEETYKTESHLDVCSFTLSGDYSEKVLDKYSHDIFLLETKSRAYKKLKTLPDWKAVYEDEQAAVFVPKKQNFMNIKLPTSNDKYYIKTKYENKIIF